MAAIPFTSSSARAAPETISAAVSVDWTGTFQTIDGFGASGAFQRATQLMEVPEPARTEIVDALFSQQTGAGLSIVRNIIGDGSLLPDGVPTIEPSPGRWQWTGDEGQIWLMQQAAQRGATRFVSTAWSAPAWMKDNGSVIGGSLSPSHYQDFADYLAAYIRGYKSRFGLDIYAVSIANEPANNAQYSSSLWSGPQFRDFIKTSLAPTFERERLSTKVMMAEDETWSEELVLDTLADAEAAKRVDIVAAHAYLGRIQAFARAAACGKPVWQSEVANWLDNDPTMDDGIKWAREVHAFMVDAKASAFLYWWFVSRRNNGGALVILDSPGATTYILNKRLFALGNFARFVRPGYVRIDCTANPAPGVFVSAYKEASSGTFVLVAINAGQEPLTIDLLPKGFRATMLKPYVTDATRNLAGEEAIGLKAMPLAARSVTTFVGKAVQ
jgi:glucuronoarabinoxylan endo-1,4-beta-xylanase